MAVRKVNRRRRNRCGFNGIPLDTWRKSRGWNYSDLARAIAVTPQAARRYCLGARMPEHDVLVRIKNVTAGAVIADSFMRGTGTVADLI